MIWPLEMPRRQKLALNLVFSFGVVVVAAAGMRTKHAVALGTDYDSTWYVRRETSLMRRLTNLKQGRILGILLDDARVEPSNHL